MQENLLVASLAFCQQTLAGLDLAALTVEMAQSLQALASQFLVLQQMDPRLLKTFNEAKYFDKLAKLLTSRAVGICSAALRLLALLLVDEEQARLYLQKGVAVLLVWQLDCGHFHSADEQSQGKRLPNPTADDRLELLRLVYQWARVAPKTLPRLVTNSLVAYARQPGLADQDHVLEILQVLVVENPRQCAWAGGVETLIKAATQNRFAGQSQATVQTLLAVFDEPDNRNFLQNYFDWRSVCALFTEAAGRTATDALQEEELREELRLAAQTLLAMLRSWTGLLYVCSERTTLCSLVEALAQQENKLVKTTLLALLRQLLRVVDFPLQRERPTYAQLAQQRVLLLAQLLLEADVLSSLGKLATDVD